MIGAAGAGKTSLTFDVCIDIYRMSAKSLLSTESSYVMRCPVTTMNLQPELLTQQQARLTAKHATYFSMIHQGRTSFP